MIKVKNRQKLVEDLVGTDTQYHGGNLHNLDISYVNKSKLQKTVIKAWKNSASYDEIQKIHDNKLSEFKDEYTPEKILVNRLVGSEVHFSEELINLVLPNKLKEELKTVVVCALENEASYDEIQMIYDNKLSELENTPEKILVDNLVGSVKYSSKNLLRISLTSNSKKELKKTIIDICLDGASCDSIQKTYDNKLDELKINEKMAL